MTERNQWLDVAKGITIMLMVVGHSSLPLYLIFFIYSFHMPLFFIASGWTSNRGKYSTSEFLFKKTKALLLPFTIYSAVVLGLQVSAGLMKIEDFVCNGWGLGYALWFIPVLFFANVLTYMIYKIEDTLARYMIAIALVLIGCILAYFHILLPWNIATIPVATVFVMLGSECRRWQRYIDEPKMWLLFCATAITIGISQIWNLDLCFNSILPFIPKFVGAISGTLMVFLLSSYIAKYTKVCSRALQAVGHETYVVVAFSQIIIMLLNQYFTLNAALKYGILVIVLVLLVNLKNTINRALKFKLL